MLSGYEIVLFGCWVVTFRRTIMLPVSGLKDDGTILVGLSSLSDQLKCLRTALFLWAVIQRVLAITC